jgi:hypothetical protein
VLERITAGAPSRSLGLLAVPSIVRGEENPTFLPGLVECSVVAHGPWLAIGTLAALKRSAAGVTRSVARAGKELAEIEPACANTSTR